MADLVRPSHSSVPNDRYSVGINPDVDGLLDPQQRPPAGWCPLCGSEIWAEGKNLCTRCERNSGVEPLAKEFRRTYVITASAPKLRGLVTWLENHHYQFREVSNADV